MSLYNKLVALVDGSRHVVDGVKVRDQEDTIEVVLNVAFECDSDDQIEDTFQAVIDIICCEMGAGFTRGVARLMHPGGVAEDDMYDPGDWAEMDFHDKSACIDVKIHKTRPERTIKYIYEI